jgi:riboflavin kinase/FMN adenylyltransferase
VFEIHVLDREDLELYGERMEVFLHEHLRREQRFESVDALKAQIAKDCEAARDVPRILPPIL